MISAEILKSYNIGFNIQNALFYKAEMISISIELYGDCLNNIDYKERKFEIAFISNSLFNTL